MPTPITHAELKEHLHQARRGSSPIILHHVGARKIKVFSPPLVSDEIQELASIALRPPPHTTIYKFGSRSVVGRFTLQSGRDVALKFYFPKNSLKKICYGLFGSRCEQSWLGAIGLTFLGIPTPTPLALLERKSCLGLWNHQSFLVKEIANGISLKKFVDQYANDPSALEHIAQQLKCHFSTMAEYHIAHGDLKDSNIIINDKQEVCFIDLDAVRFLLPEKKWQIARARDKEIFHQNWKHNPLAAKIFQNVFA